MARTKNGLAMCNAQYREATTRRDGSIFFGLFCDGQHTRPDRSVLFGVMAPRKKTLEELKSEAIAELERRGYDVRGKTPAQIKQILRRRPTKSKSDATPHPARR
jgi:hypothetical protein